MDGETFRAGDCVYVLGDDFQQAWLSDDEEEPCEVCGSTHLEVDMLECSRCLRGFHLACLRPKLKAVPKVSGGVYALMEKGPMGEHVAGGEELGGGGVRVGHGLGVGSIWPH